MCSSYQYSVFGKRESCFTYKLTCSMHYALKINVRFRVSGSSRSVCYDFCGPWLNYLLSPTLQIYNNHVQQLPASRAGTVIPEDSVHSAEGSVGSWKRIFFWLILIANKATAQHCRRETAVLCRGLEKNGIVGAWHGHGMASVNQTRPHCVNQMGKINSKPLAARHGRGTAC